MKIALWLVGFCMAMVTHTGQAQNATAGPWERLNVLSLRKSDPPRTAEERQLREAFRALWQDRLDEDEKQWDHTGVRGGTYPVRTQWVYLKNSTSKVLVSALAGVNECSPAGSFSKEDVFTWCVMRIQAAGMPAKHIDPACWIESEPGLVPDPQAFFMRARLEGAAVRIQTIQRGQPIAQCDKLVLLQ